MLKISREGHSECCSSHVVRMLRKHYATLRCLGCVMTKPENLVIVLTRSRSVQFHCAAEIKIYFNDND